MLSDEQIRHGKQAVAAEYGAQLDEFQRRKLLTPKQVGDMKAAFNDGCNAMIAVCKAAAKAGKGAKVAKGSKGSKVRTWAGL